MQEGLQRKEVREEAEEKEKATKEEEATQGQPVQEEPVS